MAAPAAGDVAYLSDLLREVDRPRYYATLFAPELVRTDLTALYGFAAEISRIPDQVSNAGLGEIRLQWWRDALLAATGGEGAANTPALRVIVPILARRALPATPLAALIDAHRADLYADPPATRGDLEGALGESESTLFQLAAILCGSAGPETADAAGHAGVAYGLARRLARFGSERRRGRSLVPADLLAAYGVAPPELFASPAPAALPSIIAELCADARSHLRAARSQLAAAPRPVRLAFLPLAVVRPTLDRVERLAATLLDRPAVLPDLEMLLRIGWARLRG